MWISEFSMWDVLILRCCSSSCACCFWPRLTTVLCSRSARRVPIKGRETYHFFSQLAKLGLSQRCSDTVISLGARTSKPTWKHWLAHVGGTTRVINHRVGRDAFHPCENNVGKCSEMTVAGRRKPTGGLSSLFEKRWGRDSRRRRCDCINGVAARHVWVPPVSFVAQVRRSIIHRAVCHIAVCLTPQLPEEESVWKARDEAAREVRRQENKDPSDLLLLSSCVDSYKRFIWFSLSEDDFKSHFSSCLLKAQHAFALFCEPISVQILWR